MQTPKEFPEWSARPAVVRLVMTKPALLAPFTATNSGKDYGDQIKPFNFIQSVIVQPQGYPHGVNQKCFHLIGPFTKDAKRWLRMRWIDRYTGKRYGITTRPPAGDVASTVAAVKSYAEVVDEYGFHPEAKSASTDGAPCRRDTAGLLQRRHVHVADIALIGKEANALDDVEAGVIADWDEVRNIYRDPAHDGWRSAAAILSAIPRGEAAMRTGLSESAISRVRQGRQQPRWRTQAALVRAAAELARHQVPDSLPPSDRAACEAYKRWLSSPPLSRKCLSCGRLVLNSRARFCTAACRLRRHRTKRQR
jgi:hypothetical protein